VTPASLLALELVDVRLPLGDLAPQLLDVRALLQVRAHRGGVGDGEHREHEDQDRRAAGEAGTSGPGTGRGDGSGSAPGPRVAPLTRAAAATGSSPGRASFGHRP